MKRSLDNNPYDSVKRSMKRAFQRGNDYDHEMHRNMTYKALRRVAKEVGAIYV